MPPTAPLEPVVPLALFDFPEPRDEMAPYWPLLFNPAIEFHPATPEQPLQGSCAQALAQAIQNRPLPVIPVDDKDDIVAGSHSQLQCYSLLELHAYQFMKY